MSQIIHDRKRFQALSTLERGMLVKAFFKAHADKIEELQRTHVGQHVVVNTDFDVIATFGKNNDELAQLYADSYGEQEDRVIFILPADCDPNLAL